MKQCYGPKSLEPLNANITLQCKGIAFHICTVVRSMHPLSARRKISVQKKASSPKLAGRLLDWAIESLSKGGRVRSSALFKYQHVALVC